MCRYRTSSRNPQPKRSAKIVGMPFVEVLER
jgi:hypothetical protein